MTREPFLTTVSRASVAAAVLGVVLVIALPRHGALGWDYFDAFVLALCFTLLGPYVDGLLLRIPGIDTGPGRLVRLAGWFAGGMWCYVVGRYLWIRFGRDLADLPSLIYGGVFLVALELAVLRRRLQTSDVRRQ